MLVGKRGKARGGCSRVEEKPDKERLRSVHSATLGKFKSEQNTFKSRIGGGEPSKAGSCWEVP